VIESPIKMARLQRRRQFHLQGQDRREAASRGSRAPPAIRNEFDDKVDLRVDYNQALAPFGAIKILRDVGQFAPQSSPNRILW